MRAGLLVEESDSWFSSMEDALDHHKYRDWREPDASDSN